MSYDRSRIARRCAPTIFCAPYFLQTINESIEWIGGVRGKHDTTADSRDYRRWLRTAFLTSAGGADLVVPSCAGAAVSSGVAGPDPPRGLPSTVLALIHEPNSFPSCWKRCRFLASITLTVWAISFAAASSSLVALMCAIRPVSPSVTAVSN
jgi:hypothetical protein